MNLMLCRVTSAAVMRKPRNQPVRIMRYAALVQLRTLLGANHPLHFLMASEQET